MSKAPFFIIVLSAVLLLAFPAFAQDSESCRLCQSGGPCIYGCAAEFSKEVDKTSAKSGDTVTYTIRYKQDGPSPIKFKITDLISGKLDGASVSVSGGSYDAGSKLITWNVQANPGETGSVTFTVNIAAGLTSGTVQNSATIGPGDGQPPFSSYSTNSVATSILPPPSGDGDGGGGCTTNCGGGGGGGGGGGPFLYAKIEVNSVVPVPKTQAGTVVIAKVAVKNIGNVSAEKVELAAELPKEFEYSVGQIITGTSTVISGYNTNITLSGNEHYGRLWNLGDIKEGNNLNISIPVKVKSGTPNGIYKIKVFARANNEISSNKEVRAEILVEVIGAVVRKPKPPVTPIAVKPSPKPVPKPKLMAVATSTPKVCISADEYAALVASSTRLAKELENKNKLGLLAAVGDVFDLGTGNISFGLLVLFLLILALIIAARLVFHYLDYKDGKNGAEESKNQLPLIQD